MKRRAEPSDADLWAEAARMLPAAEAPRAFAGCTARCPMARTESGDFVCNLHLARHVCGHGACPVRVGEDGMITCTLTATMLGYDSHGIVSPEDIERCPEVVWEQRGPGLRDYTPAFEMRLRVLYEPAARQHLGVRLESVMTSRRKKMGPRTGLHQFAMINGVPWFDPTPTLVPARLAALAVELARVNAHETHARSAPRQVDLFIQAVTQLAIGDWRHGGMCVESAAWMRAAFPPPVVRPKLKMLMGIRS